MLLWYFHILQWFTEAVVSSGRVEKSPHEQEIKFFAKVRILCQARRWRPNCPHLCTTKKCENSLSFSLSQILMPLINQYFKNHCLYFLSTPAKVLGSGGHSSNKEKEMIARWSLFFMYRNITHIHVLLCILFIYHFPPFYQRLRFLAFSFPFLPFPSHHSIFCKMSALVRHRVSLFGKMLVSQHQSESFHSFLCLSYVSAVYFSITQVRTECSWSCFIQYVVYKIYFYVQERMLRQLLTVFTFWHAHWMQGLVLSFNLHA